MRARTGTELVQRQLAQDKMDASGHNGHDPVGGETEVRDDYAGIEVGIQMHYAIQGKTNGTELRGRIYQTLCSLDE